MTDLGLIVLSWYFVSFFSKYTIIIVTIKFYMHFVAIFLPLSAF